MEIYGADIKGISGNLIKFSVVREAERSGFSILGLASKGVKEGVIRASKAIETSLEGDWSALINKQGYTIDLSPAEVPKFSSGLDLPIAIMLLQACIMKGVDEINHEIKKLKDEANSINIKKEERKRILDKLEDKLNEKELIVKYRNRLCENKNKYLLTGKLGITNGLLEKPYYGMLSLISSAQDNFILIVPEESETLAALFVKANPKIKAYIAKDLQEVWNVLLSIQAPRKAKYKKSSIREKRLVDYIPDLKAINGVTKAKLALRVALAGGHNMLLLGPPGQGKTMLAKAAIGMMPELTREELFEVNKIYSTKGELKGGELVLKRPYQEAYNTITEVALMGGGGGGGAGHLLPGLVSLAHRGILFFDEINLCKGTLIQELRTAMTNNKVSVQKACATIEYPANFILLAAMNPCKCGWFRHKICVEDGCGHISIHNKVCPIHQVELISKCRCTKSEIKSYIGKLSDPLLDRIDLKVLVSSFDDNSSRPFEFATVTVKREINNARAIQQKRYSNSNFIHCNADVPDKHEYSIYDDISQPVEQHLNDSYKKYNISTKRMEMKVLLVARTIADLEGADKIRKKDVDLAIELMGLDDDVLHTY